MTLKLINKIRKDIRKIKESLDEPALIILNEEDFRELRSKLIFNQDTEIHSETSIKIFGIDLRTIPIWLYDKKILEKGKAIVLSKSAYKHYMKNVKWQ